MLLSSSGESPHGFRAKISDFGLARDIGTATKLETRTYGTITHMAPEVLTSDYISKVIPSQSTLPLGKHKPTLRALHRLLQSVTLHGYAFWRLRSLSFEQKRS